jgi:hypothetical protein
MNLMYNNFLFLATSFETLPNTTTSSTVLETPITPSAASNIEFFDNTSIENKEGKPEMNVSSTVNITPPVTPVVGQTKNQEKEQTSKPKSYRDAIAKKDKSATTTSTEIQPASTTKSNKSNKQQKKAAAKSSGNPVRTPRGHPQDTNDYYDDSWYYGNGEEGYLSTGYTDDQEIFVGNLSAQVTENEVKTNRNICLFLLINYLIFRFMDYFDLMVIFFLFVLVIQDLKLVQQILRLLFVNRLKWQKPLYLIMKIF